VTPSSSRRPSLGMVATLVLAGSILALVIAFCATYFSGPSGGTALQEGTAFQGEDGTSWAFFAPLGAQVEIAPIELENEGRHPVTVTAEDPVVDRGANRFRETGQFLTSLTYGPYKPAEAALTPRVFLALYGPPIAVRPIVYEPCPTPSCAVRAHGHWRNASSIYYMQTKIVVTHVGIVDVEGFNLYYTCQGRHYKEYVSGRVYIHVITRRQMAWADAHNRVGGF